MSKRPAEEHENGGVSLKGGDRPEKPDLEDEFGEFEDEFEDDGAATTTLPDPLPINGVAVLLGRDRDLGNLMISRCIPVCSVFGMPCS